MQAEKYSGFEKICCSFPSAAVLNYKVKNLSQNFCIPAETGMAIQPMKGI